jgi:acyl-CoA thioester hydrolase
MADTVRGVQPNVGALDLRQRAAYARWTRDKIRFGDLDRHNHLNNVALCSMLESGRVELREALDPAVAHDDTSAWLLVTLSISFLGSMSYPGIVEIGTRPIRVGRSSFELAQGAFDGERCLATALIKTVHTDRRTMASAPLPPSFRAALLAEGAEDARS